MKKIGVSLLPVAFCAVAFVAVSRAPDEKLSGYVNGHEGHHVSVTGEKTGMSIHLSDVTMVAAKYRRQTTLQQVR
jgi:hypothetical protein